VSLRAKEKYKKLTNESPWIWQMGGVALKKEMVFVLCSHQGRLSNLFHRVLSEPASSRNVENIKNEGCTLAEESR
jgi:hypothetical protein